MRVRLAFFWTVPVLVFALLFAAAEAPAGGRIRIGRGEDLIWRLPLEEKLRKPISMSFVDAPVEDVVNFFRVALKLNIVIDGRIRNEEQRLVTLRLQDIEGRKGLDWVMNLTGLRYEFRAGAVYITTPARARLVAIKYFRIYDVRDLTRSAVRSGGGGDDDGGSNEDGGNDSNGGNGGSGGSRDLVRLLVQLTGPKNWQSVTILGGGDDNDENSFGADDF